jgi:hypothetical protein
VINIAVYFVTTDFGFGIRFNDTVRPHLSLLPMIDLHMLVVRCSRQLWTLLLKSALLEDHARWMKGDRGSCLFQIFITAAFLKGAGLGSRALLFLATFTLTSFVHWPMPGSGGCVKLSWSRCTIKRTTKDVRKDSRTRDLAVEELIKKGVLWSGLVNVNL